MFKKLFKRKKKETKRHGNSIQSSSTNSDSLNTTMNHLNLMSATDIVLGSSCSSPSSNDNSYSDSCSSYSNGNSYSDSSSSYSDSSSSSSSWD